LGEPDESMRMAALMALSEREARRAALDTARLIDDPSPEIRDRAIEALGNLGNPEAAPALAAAFSSDDYQLSRMASDALRAIGPGSAPALIDALALPGERVRELVVSTLVALDPPPLEEVARALIAPERRDGARETLVRAADRSLVVLGVLAVDAPTELAREIAVVLGEIADPRGEPPLRLLAQHEDAGVRAAAARALGAAARANALDILGSLLEDPEPAVRNAALEAIRPYVESSFEEILIRLAREEATRENALLALGGVGTPGARRALQRYTRSSDADVRRTAAVALGAGKDRAAARILLPLLRDRDPGVRLAAIQSLIRIDSPGTPAELKRLYRRSRSCAERLPIYSYLARKNEARGLSQPLEGAVDVCTVCGSCGTREIGGTWYCDRHFPNREEMVAFP